MRCIKCGKYSGKVSKRYGYTCRACRHPRGRPRKKIVEEKKHAEISIVLKEISDKKMDNLLYKIYEILVKYDKHFGLVANNHQVYKEKLEKRRN